MTNFQANLSTAYRRIEELLSSHREHYRELLEEHPELTNRLSPIIPPEDWQPSYKGKRRGQLPSRMVLSLGEGYAVKIRVTKGRGITYLNTRLLLNTNQISIEEDNVKQLRRHGFTKDKGFWVPDHKVVGVNIEDGLINVDEDKYGLTITEDLTEDGEYTVTDIDPTYFSTLENAQEFWDDYLRHMGALLALCYDPAINATINRHERITGNPIIPIHRTLLARIKDNRGEIVIGDLDNIVFDEIEE